jgi:hypothetical protein
MISDWTRPESSPGRRRWYATDGRVHCAARYRLRGGRGRLWSFWSKRDKAPVFSTALVKRGNVEVLTVTAEQARELVEFTFVEVQLGVVVRIATEAVTEGSEEVDKRILGARERMQLKGLTQHAGPD